MATRKRRAATSSGYEKISATLERPLLREIRERTANVSGFLNAAAKDKLYIERAREGELELERQGVPHDEKLYQRLKAALVGPAARRRPAPRR